MLNTKLLQDEITWRKTKDTTSGLTIDKKREVAYINYRSSSKIIRLHLVICPLLYSKFLTVCFSDQDTYSNFKDKFAEIEPDVFEFQDYNIRQLSFKNCSEEQYSTILDHVDFFSKFPKEIKEEIKTILEFRKIKDEADIFNSLIGIYTDKGINEFTCEAKLYSNDYPEVMENLFTHFSEQMDIDECCVLLNLLNTTSNFYQEAAFQIGHFFMLNRAEQESDADKRSRLKRAITYFDKAGDFPDAKILANRLLAELSGNMALNLDYSNKLACIFQMTDELQQMQEKINVLEQAALQKEESKSRLSFSI
jgi:hypothetical protein